MSTIHPTLNISIDVDDSGMDRLFESLEKDANTALDKLKEEVEWALRIKASEKLNTSKQAWLDGLRVERDGDTIIGILSGALPVAVEKGFKQFDMKAKTLGNALSKIIPIGKSAGKTPVFRTMSSTSSGWMHPGVEKRNIGGQVEDDIEDIIKEAFTPMFRKSV